MWRRVGLLRTDALEERVASILRVEKIRLEMEATHSSEKFVLVTPTRRHIAEDCILRRHLCGNLKLHWRF
jgi:hypothetical protein